jgi:hypothetical protein
MRKWMKFVAVAVMVGTLWGGTSADAVDAGVPVVAESTGGTSGGSIGAVVETPTARVMPAYTRNCNWYHCTIWFNRRETRLLSVGGSYIATIGCGAFRSFPLFALCATVGWAIGAWADRAYANHRCVKFSFSTIALGYPYGYATYSDWRCS